MKKYFYLVTTPESLIASHLPPDEFGHYMSVGTKKRTRGQNIFFELNPDKLKDLPEENIEKNLVPYPNGEPKRSVFCSIYRVLENTPLAALKSLYLSTDDGKVLELHSSEYEEIEMVLSFYIGHIRRNFCCVSKKRTKLENYFNSKLFSLS